MPRWVVLGVLVVAALSLVPFALIARARTSRTPLPRIHPVQDMDNQSSFAPQQVNGLFADRRAMRPHVEGTVAHGNLRADDHYYRGVVDGRWAERFPVEVDRALLERGRERYGIYCAPCHGLAGYGDGLVARRADRLMEGTWVPPSSFHTELVRQRPPGQLFNTVTHGIRNMGGYGSQIPVHDRWAVVAWLSALQRSQNATLDDVPAAMRGEILPPREQP